MSLERGFKGKPSVLPSGVTCIVFSPFIRETAVSVTRENNKSVLDLPSHPMTGDCVFRGSHVTLSIPHPMLGG